jgi:F-type H+-transporting ATPase subunit b
MGSSPGIAGDDPLFKTLKNIHMGLVSPNPGTIFWMVIVFGIVMLILKKFAWKPILNALKERENSISNALMSAEKARKEVANLKADHESIRLEAQREKEQILKEARDIKEKMIAEAREKAQSEALKAVEQAREQIQLEKVAAINDIRKQVVILSVNIAEKVIRQKISPNAEQEKMIDLMLKDLTLN